MAGQTREQDPYGRLDTHTTTRCPRAIVRNQRRKANTRRMRVPTSQLEIQHNPATVKVMAEIQTKQRKQRGRYLQNRKNEQKRNPVEQDFANKQLRVQVMKNKSQTKWREEGKVKATGSGG